MGCDELHRNQEPWSHDVHAGYGQAQQIYRHDVTREGVSRQDPGTELTKVKFNRTKATELESVVSPGSGHGHEHGEQDRPTLEGHLPGKGQCQGVSAWTTQTLGREWAKAPEQTVECFSLQDPGFLRVDLATSKSLCHRRRHSDTHGINLWK